MFERVSERLAAVAKSCALGVVLTAPLQAQEPAQKESSPVVPTALLGALGTVAIGALVVGLRRQQVDRRLERLVGGTEELSPAIMTAYPQLDELRRLGLRLEEAIHCSNQSGARLLSSFSPLAQGEHSCGMGTENFIAARLIEQRIISDLGALCSSSAQTQEGVSTRATRESAALDEVALYSAVPLLHAYVGLVGEECRLGAVAQKAICAIAARRFSEAEELIFSDFSRVPAIQEPLLKEVGAIIFQLSEIAGLASDFVANKDPLEQRAAALTLRCTLGFLEGPAAKRLSRDFMIRAKFVHGLTDVALHANLGPAVAEVLQKFCVEQSRYLRGLCFGCDTKGTALALREPTALTVVPGGGVQSRQGNVILN